MVEVPVYLHVIHPSGPYRTKWIILDVSGQVLTESEAILLYGVFAEH